MAYNETVNTNPPVVRLAISGKMRSGKDTLADRLVERYGLRKYAFADGLKDVARELFGMRPGTKNRHLLVELGRKMCEIDRLVWVNQVLGKMPLRQDVVISDLRFQYEYHALKAFGFVVARVDCDHEARMRRIEKYGSRVDMALLDDPSETDLDGMDFDWRLDGTTYEALYRGGDEMMSAMGKGPA